MFLSPLTAAQRSPDRPLCAPFVSYSPTSSSSVLAPLHQTPSCLRSLPALSNPIHTCPLHPPSLAATPSFYKCLTSCFHCVHMVAHLIHQNEDFLLLNFFFLKRLHEVKVGFHLPDFLTWGLIVSQRLSQTVRQELNRLLRVSGWAQCLLMANHVRFTCLLEANWEEESLAPPSVPLPTFNLFGYK